MVLGDKIGLKAHVWSSFGAEIRTAPMTHTLLDSRHVASPAGARLCSLVPRNCPRTRLFWRRRGVGRRAQAATLAKFKVPESEQRDVVVFRPEPVCGESLISPESAIRHTQARK